MDSRLPGSVTSASAIGPRPGQEDRYVAERVERGWLIGVFDGHGGPEASETAADHLVEAWTRALERHHDARAAMEAAIGMLRDRCADLVAGSSASVAYVDEEEGRCVVGVLGDSPVIVHVADGETTIGPIHNTSTHAEDVEEAVERGAELSGPYLVDPASGDGVNLTRTIGDAKLTFLGREPEVFEAALGEGSFVCVASDGVFSESRATPAELLAWIVGSVDDGMGAEELVRQALDDGSTDNVTVVLWRAD